MTPEILPLLPNLKTLVDEHVRKVTEPERRQQMAEIRRNYAYWNADQYVAPVYNNRQEVVDYRTASGNLRYPSGLSDSATDYVVNHIRGDGKTLISVLGQRAPNGKATPDRPDDEATQRQTVRVNSAISKLRALWEVEKIQRSLSKAVWLAGTSFGRVRWTANGRKYGWTEIPQLDTVMEPDGPGQYTCSACGAPSPEMVQCLGCGKFLQPEEFTPPQEIPVTREVGPPKRYPKGAPELTLESPLRVLTNFYGTGVESLPWLWYEREEHQAIVLAAFNDGMHPEAMEKLWALRGKSTSAHSTDQTVRDAVTSPTSQVMPRPDRWRYAEGWLRPEMFMLVRDDGVRDQLLGAFPNGARLIMVEDDIIDVAEVDLSHEWSVCFPEPPDSMYPDPLCTDMISVQDIINDCTNFNAEAAERVSPVTFADPQVINEKFWKKNPPRPGTVTFALPGSSGRLKDALATIPTTQLDASLVGWIESLVTRARELVGASPALAGTESPVQTAYQASRQLNQALMKLSPIWNEMRDFWQATYLNGIRALKTFDPEWQDLSLDGWHITVEEAIPMTWGQKRDFLILLLEQGPEAWTMLGLNDPSNLFIVSEALGLAGWRVPQQEERNHILDTLRQLLQEQAMPAPIDPMTGAPLGPPQASRPPDDLEFNPSLVVQVVHEWMQGDEARQAREQNPPGYENVTAWGRSYLMLAMPPPPPEGGPGQAPPPSEGEAPPEGARDLTTNGPTPPSIRMDRMPGPQTPLPTQ